MDCFTVAVDVQVDEIQGEEMKVVKSCNNKLIPRTSDAEWLQTRIGSGETEERPWLLLKMRMWEWDCVLEPETRAHPNTNAHSIELFHYFTNQMPLWLLPRHTLASADESAELFLPSIKVLNIFLETVCTR